METGQERIEPVTSTPRPCGAPCVALIVEDDADTRAAMKILIDAEGFDVDEATSLRDARGAIESRTPHVVLCDIVLPDGNGLDLLKTVDAARTDFVAVTGKASVDTVVSALREGALDYLTKPVDVKRLKRILVEVAAARGGASSTAASLEDARRNARFGSLIGKSPPMIRLFQQIQRVAPTDATVLLQGETGTGKELVAQTIHEISPRCAEPFIPLNCGAVSQTLIESELFGHEKGAFTGADRRHLGVFERAQGGTLFLDEITEMPMELQVKLLRVLESRTFNRVGGEQTIATTARMIAATNRSPEEAIRQGKLREDLFYRLRVFPIQLPPLRAREGDAVILAEHLVREHVRVSGRKVTLDDSARNWIAAQSWPGNVRELRNILERAFILTDDVIDAASLRLDESDANDEGASVQPSSRDPEPASARVGEPSCATPTGQEQEIRVRIGATIAEAERSLILATLESNGGDKSKTARTLGISLKTLYSRLSVYNATPRDA